MFCSIKFLQVLILIVTSQSTQRIHALHSVAPAISGHVRAQDLVAATLPIAATAFSVSPSLANQKV